MGDGVIRGEGGEGEAEGGVIRSAEAETDLAMEVQHYRLPTAELEELRSLAARRGVTVSELVRGGVRRVLRDAGRRR